MAKIRDMLSNLFVKITVHLASEDKVIYPMLFASEDPGTNQTAKDFAEEMGMLGAEVKTFRGRWNSDDTGINL